jgi:hypothetical protein
VTSVTPGILEKYSSTPQKHPPAKYTSRRPDAATVGFFSIIAVPRLFSFLSEGESSAAIAGVAVKRTANDKNNLVDLFMISSLIRGDWGSTDLFLRWLCPLYSR